MKRGLILEGGGMRGLFTCGVTDLLMENNIIFDGIIGVSAGAAFGCNIKSGQCGRALRYNTTYCNDPRYCSFSSLVKTGDLFGADFCYREIPEELDLFDIEAYRSSPVEFYAVVTNIETGKAEYHKCDLGNGEDLLWIRASASMPLVSRIVNIGSNKYLDGGIADSIPLRAAEELGYEGSVVVLTQPRGYFKEKNKLLPLMKLVFRKYPKLLDAMERRHEMYNESLEYVAECEKRGDVFVIAPREKLIVGRIEKDPDILSRVYANGRDTCNERLEDLCIFLNDNT